MSATTSSTDLLENDRFTFVEGDITINREWIEYHVKKCDVVIPLVAIANPTQYVKRPLDVFELDFEANLDIVRQCVKYKKRLIFPSTSEVYGMSPDSELDESTSNLVYGPIDKQRWIYAASKQLLDRVIYAYGVRDDLDYTLFRPFNWIGPKLDNVMEPKEGSSRLFTQFISNVIFRKPIQLVDGGSQSRSFTYHRRWCGLPAAHHREQERRRIAGGSSTSAIRTTTCRSPISPHIIIEAFKDYPEYREHAAQAQVVSVSSLDYFGKYYQDIHTRVPSIAAASEAHRLGTQGGSQDGHPPDPRLSSQAEGSRPHRRGAAS